MTILQYPFALKALVLCFILTGIHTYLGYHVVRRGIFFIDLSLAQVAALGSSAGVLLGWGHELAVQNYLLSLGFTMLGALLFVLFRRHDERIPIEALIGVTYAGAMALSLLVLERSATGTEEIKEMLAGSILTVSDRELLFIAAMYSCIGLVHWIARKPLLLVTENPGEARKRALRLWWWDFVFYATFGFVVTSSVRVAGVLLVFSFLIVPAVAATAAVRGTGRRIVFGWLFGGLGCTAGLELSLRWDLSPAPAIIAAFLVLLVVTWCASSRRPTRA